MRTPSAEQSPPPTLLSPSPGTPGEGRGGGPKADHSNPRRELKAIIRPDHLGPNLQLFTAKGFEWTDVQLPVPSLPDDLEGFRILHITDIHARRNWDDAYDDLIARVKSNPPDLIVHTGDFVDDKHDSRLQFPIARRLVNSLPARLGMVTILGNHDGDLLGPPLASLNLTLVEHKCLALHSGSATIEIIGIAGVERTDFDPAFLHSLGPKKPQTLRILLSHFPDLIRKSQFLSPDLYLAGHTHGGQVCLPGRRPIIRHDSLPAQFIGGINRWGGAWLIVNRGLGFSSIPIRLFCPAEVIEITLRKAGVS